eukprot:30959-Pelagococcus_subviridis.AAC.3
MIKVRQRRGHRPDERADAEEERGEMRHRVGSLRDDPGEPCHDADRVRARLRLRRRLAAVAGVVR